MLYKQVFIINQDLKMGKGKIAVQVAHGEVYYMSEIAGGNMEKQLFGDICEHTDKMIKNYWEWIKDDNNLMKKVVLKASQEQMDEIVEDLCFQKIWCSVVYDRGLTQIPEDSLTCVVVEPLLEEQCNKLFGSLKLL